MSAGGREPTTPNIVTTVAGVDSATTVPPQGSQVSLGDAHQAAKVEQREGLSVILAGSRVAWGDVLNALDSMDRRGPFLLRIADTGKQTPVLKMPTATAADLDRSMSRVLIASSGKPVDVSGKTVGNWQDVREALRAGQARHVVILADKATPFSEVLVAVELIVALGATPLFGVAR
jgi:hypothetical protein